MCADRAYLNPARMGAVLVRALSQVQHVKSTTRYVPSFAIPLLGNPLCTEMLELLEMLGTADFESAVKTVSRAKTADNAIPSRLAPDARMYLSDVQPNKLRECYSCGKRDHSGPSRRNPMPVLWGSSPPGPSPDGANITRCIPRFRPGTPQKSQGPTETAHRHR